MTWFLSFRDSVMKQLCRKKQLQHFWAKCVDNVVLYANSETFLAHLERCYGPEIRETYDINAGKGTKLRPWKEMV